MRIREINVTPVAFRDPPLLNAAGVHEPWALRTIVEIVTDEGLTGLGETYGDLDHLVRVRDAAEALIGHDVYGHNAMYATVAGLVGADVVTDLHGLTGTSSRAKTVDRIFSPSRSPAWTSAARRWTGPSSTCSAAGCATPCRTAPICSTSGRAIRARRRTASAPRSTPTGWSSRPAC
ncbi:hypothetical protein GCM10027612_32310 [Microbispora bryophytorum subsp. camponoti]